MCSTPFQWHKTAILQGRVTYQTVMASVRSIGQQYHRNASLDKINKAIFGPAGSHQILRGRKRSSIASRTSKDNDHSNRNYVYINCLGYRNGNGHK